MTPRELLAWLQGLDVRLSAEGDRLRVNAPEGVLTPELRERLSREKPEILAFLKAGEVWSAPHTCIVPLRSGGSRTPFFGVPGHNGDVFCYVRLAEHLGPDQPFYALQPPGLDDQRPPLRDVRELAALYARQLCAFRPRGPFLLGGYCLGGTVAFETARELLAMGRAVELLVLFASPCPTCLRPWPRLVAKARNLAALGLRQARGLGGRTPSEWVDYVASRLRERLQTPDEAARRTAAVEEATLAAVGHYDLPRYPGRITLLLPCEAWRHSDDRPMDWARFAAGGLETFTGPPDGSSDLMLREPHVAWAAERLGGVLARVKAGEPAAKTA